MGNELEVLKSSMAELRALVESLKPEQLRAQAYPTEWKVDGVLSHIGSGAEIATLWIDQALGGPEVDPKPIWDEWNAKDPDTRAADTLKADRALIERLEGLSDDDRARFSFAIASMHFDLSGFVRLRLNEHVMHSWDVRVTFDPTATLPPDAAAIVLEALPMIAVYAGKPTGATTSILVRTTDPERSFTVELTETGAAIIPGDDVAPTDANLELPTEAFVRLVYGRLDVDHTPGFTGDAVIVDRLRRAFPGV
jgi:uncharacterized protein (TIGR03083 family)